MISTPPTPLDLSTWVRFALLSLHDHPSQTTTDQAVALLLPALTQHPKLLTLHAHTLHTALEASPKFAAALTPYVEQDSHLRQHLSPLNLVYLFSQRSLKTLAQPILDDWLTSLTAALTPQVEQPTSTPELDTFFRHLTTLAKLPKFTLGPHLLPWLGQHPSLARHTTLEQWHAWARQNWASLAPRASLFSAKDWVQTLPSWGTTLSVEEIEPIFHVLRADTKSPTYVPQRLSLPLSALLAGALPLAEALIQQGYPLDSPHSRFSSSVVAYLAQTEEPRTHTQALKSLLKGTLSALTEKEWMTALMTRLSKFGDEANPHRFAHVIHALTGQEPPRAYLLAALQLRRTDWALGLTPAFSTCALDQPLDELGNHIWHVLFASEPTVKKLSPSFSHSLLPPNKKVEPCQDKVVTTRFLQHVFETASSQIETPNHQGVLPVLVSNTVRFKNVNYFLPLDKPSREKALLMLTPSLVGKTMEGGHMSQAEHVFSILKPLPEVFHVIEHAWLQQRANLDPTHLMRIPLAL